jgi:ribosomal protein S18 acetylase RimI-like enzyme
VYFMKVTVEVGGHWPDAVAVLLRDLPDWFGIEESNRAYIAAAETLDNTAAMLDGEIAGICLVRDHTATASEIELLAVRSDLHRRGVGRVLVAHVERDLRTRGITLLQVKTRGPSLPSPAYERTRAFYQALGFVPLEERTDIWGAENPCLISVKVLC